jgi:hypothetical protein
MIMEQENHYFKDMIYDGIDLRNEEWIQSGVVKVLSAKELKGMKIRNVERVPCTDKEGSIYEDEPYLKIVTEDNREIVVVATFSIRSGNAIHEYPKFLIIYEVFRGKMEKKSGGEKNDE